jgi:hypothetical protein
VARQKGEVQMTDFLLERKFGEPFSVNDFFESSAKSVGCFDLYGVDWMYTMRATEGRRFICWFRSVDMESVRVALRAGGTDISVLWSGSVHDAPDMSESDIVTANVIVERSFKKSVALEDIQAIEDAGASCLDIRGVKFMRTFFSTDRKRMICLYSAPDVESVREAQREAGMPVDAVWGFAAIRPEDLAASG